MLMHEAKDKSEIMELMRATAAQVLSKREEFAMHAMAGLLSRKKNVKLDPRTGRSLQSCVAHDAVVYADALLHELASRGPEVSDWECTPPVKGGE